MTENNEYNVIGKRVPKVDAREKATGAAIFGHDLRLPGMLEGKILRSKRAHANFTIDISKAEKIPGVVAVITAETYPHVKNLGFLQDNPALKKGKVCSYRDEIAAVAAVNPETAEDAINAIEVEYEDLPNVCDIEFACMENAPVLHEHAPDNILKHRYDFVHGDPEKALEEADFKVTSTYRLQYVAHCCMEPCFAAAQWDGPDRLTVYSTTQIPHLMQRDLGRVLGIPAAHIRIKQMVIGGAFGSKLDTYPYEIITCLLAKKTGRPVRIAFDREEEFIASVTRQPAVITVSHGCTKDGKLTARIFDAVLDNGSNSSWGATTPHIMANPVSSLYKVENVRMKAKMVYTNNAYAGAFRGYGNPQATFAIESNLDELAKVAGIDPLELRRRNFNEPGETTPQDLKITTCGMKECTEAAVEAIDYDKPLEEWEGVGFANMIHVGGGARIYLSDGSGVTVKVDDFGRVVIITGATEIGQGTDTAMAMIASEELGVPLENISILNSDTDYGMWDAGVHASRTTFIVGNATLRACRMVKEQLIEAAAKKMKIEPGKVVFEKGVFYPEGGSPEDGMKVDKVARSMHFRRQGKHPMATYYYDPPNELQDMKTLKGNVSSTYAYGTHACRVKVDPETGKVKILKFVAAHDVGKVINRQGIEGQLHGGIAQGIGYALMEDMVFEDGKLLNPNLLDYKLVMARDMPPMELIFIETDDPEGPYGAKGIGEAGLIPTAAAIANAVESAIGARIRDLPITPEKVLAAIRGVK
ncbi:MAG: xanthine dehydrogenase family protein molybdopterin-binding subunit [Planctomycetota bacterium]|nr:MAG: xanthine dehydrogenase family protein molybdopterin-binding subunit [Planctomycetota bacterium]